MHLPTHSPHLLRFCRAPCEGDYLPTHSPHPFSLLQVPFVDVRGAMEDPDLPLTQQEYLEWGDPRVPEYAALMDSYCPYTNIAKGCVPPSILLTCRAPRSCRTHWLQHTLDCVG